MSWKEDLAQAKHIFKTGTPKEKAEYIWDYYKIPILVILILIYLIGNIVHSRLTAKEYVLQGLFLNTLTEAEAVQELEDGFLEVYPIDQDKEDIFLDTSIYYLPDSDQVSLDTSYQAIQVLSVKVAAGEIDFMATETPVLTEFAYDGYFYDLSEVLSNEQYTKYEPYLLYYDKAVMRELSNVDYTLEEAESVILPDPAKPELMKEPVPVMINITGSEKLSFLYPNTAKDYSFALIVNGSHTEKALELLEYLF